MLFGLEREEEKSGRIGGNRRLEGGRNFFFLIFQSKKKKMDVETYNRRTVNAL